MTICCRLDGALSHKSGEKSYKEGNRKHNFEDCPPDVGCDPHEKTQCSGREHLADEGANGTCNYTANNIPALGAVSWLAVSHKTQVSAKRMGGEGRADLVGLLPSSLSPRPGEQLASGSARGQGNLPPIKDAKWRHAFGDVPPLVRGGGIATTQSSQLLAKCDDQRIVAVPSAL